MNERVFDFMDVLYIYVFQMPLKVSIDAVMILPICAPFYVNINSARVLHEMYHGDPQVFQYAKPSSSQQAHLSITGISNRNQTTAKVIHIGS